MKLTAKSLTAVRLPAGKTDHIAWDPEIPGLGLRVRAGGSRVWVFQYALGEKQRRMALGAATAESFKTEKRKGQNGEIEIVNLGIRERAAQLHARVKLGQDPAGEKEQGRRRAVDLFETLVKKYLALKKESTRPGSYTEIERHLLKHARTLHGLQISKISKNDIATVLRAIKQDVAHNRARASLSAFFTWALAEGIPGVDYNPVVGTSRRGETSRARVLLPAELRVIWKALGENQYGDIIKLLLLTMQREAEIGGLRRSEWHGEVIVLPAARTKNGLDHVVPLAAKAKEILDRQDKRVQEDGTIRDLIFGSGEGPFSGWSKAKRTLDARICRADCPKCQGTGFAQLQYRTSCGVGFQPATLPCPDRKPLPHWTIHDVRRTAATYISGGLPEHLSAKLSPRDKTLAKGLGVQPHVREAILNHVSGYRAGVSGVYDRSTYADEKRAGLNLWAIRLMEIVEDSNVTPMRQTA